MPKIVTLIFIFVNILYASSFNFTELRYNDALGRSTQLQGKITFSANALNINYDNGKKILDYRDNNLVYMEDKKPKEISEQQAQGIIQYFEILMMLHKGDESSLDGEFEINKANGMTILTPIGSAKYFLNKVELYRDKKQLRQVKLFLKNGDSIMISIDNEIL